MYSLRNKTVFITGSSSGIGEACAYAFAAEGTDLILTARRDGVLQKLAEELTTRYKISCYHGRLDVRDRSSVEDFIKGLPADFLAIDVLVNNAGLARGLDTIQDGSIEDWEEMIDTNIKGLLNITRSVVPGMIERSRGHIINIGSIAGRQVYPRGAVYCATKFAVRALNQGMLMDLVETPIRVSTVDPGMTRTEFSRVRFRGDDARADAVYQSITPLEAKDIAEAVLFCVTRPQHVNISEMVVLPTDQASPYHVSK